MKTLFTLSLLFVAALVMAQTKVALPRTDFTVVLSESSLAIKPGESKQVTLSIARSKYFAKEKATLGLQSTLPKGVSVSYEPKEGIFETSVVTISVSSDAPAGAYQIVLSAMLSTKKKGEIVKLTVGIDEVAVK
jgi:uncharacterized membrane protein